MKFVIRCEPLPGESLSSLRYRTALANTMSFKDVGKTGMRRRDPDSFRGEEELRWLAQACDRESELLRSLSLDALREPIFGRFGAREHPPWLLQTKYSSASTLRQTTYCVECLREKPAYFRLCWRLAVFTTCPRHGVMLNDCCPACGYWVWPATSGRAAPELERWHDLDICPRCGGSLVDVPAVPASCARDLYFGIAIRRGVVDLDHGLRVDSAGYFAALRAVCQLFVRKTSGTLIESSGSAWATLAAEARLSSRSHHVERLSIELRSKLLDGSHHLLGDWPGSFLRFARSTSLSYVHLSPARLTYPDWFSHVLDTELRQQRRGVTREQVARGVAALEERSLKVTKVAVRQALGLGYPAAIDQLLSRRQRSTEAELQEVLGSYAAEFRGETGRRRVRLSMLRDHVFFYTAVLTGRSFGEIAGWDRQRVGESSSAACRQALSGVKGRMVESLAQAWAAYLSLESEVDFSSSVGAGLYCPRGGSGARSAQKCLAGHMSGLDARLWRSVQVFWRACEGTE